LNGKATADVARKILNHISTTEPNSKTIVFSKRTKQSILVCGEKFVYNGEIAQKKATSNYEDFVVGTKKVLGVCDKVNRGANIPNLNIGLFETFFGSDTKATQRFGRLMRLHPKEKATAYILLPYYMRKEKNNTYTLQKTQQVVWAENMLRSTKINSSTIWDYCAIKS
jgi:superfamily II DNA or RNA helicase